MGINKKLRLSGGFNWPLVGAMLALCAMGVAFVYSAAYRGEDMPTAHFWRMQLVWMAIGLCVFLVAALIDYHTICRWVMAWYPLAIVLLVLVLAVGGRVYGAKRWLGVGGFGIQPSEFAKIAVIIAVAYYLCDKTVELRRWKPVWVVLVLAGVPILLVLMQPDLGSAMVLVPISVAMLFVAGVRLRYFVILAVAAMALSPFAWMNLKEYQKDRILVFLNPSKDPLYAGWNLNQSLIAVGSGGVTGKGYLRGTQNLLGYLPRTVAPNDFIFSVIAEEKGFLGSVAVLGLYAVALFSGIRIASEARDRLGLLLATGLVTMLFSHIFINIGMTVGLLPITGLPLPLLSYGGSFVLATMLAMGLLQNIWIHRR
jgi:rod shape determining protein RodA